MNGAMKVAALAAVLACSARSPMNREDVDGE